MERGISEIHRAARDDVELAQGAGFEIPFIQMMRQVLANHGLYAFVENEFGAAMYQISRVRLMVPRNDEPRARELLEAFFGSGFLIRGGDLYSD